MNLQRRIFGVVASLFCAAAAHAAPLLNVDYAVGITSPNTGPAAIGLSPTDFWNSSVVPNIPGSLKWSDGTPSSAGLTVENGGGVWGTDSTDPMLHTYRYPSSHTGNVVSRFTSFPSGTYDIYVYAHGQPRDENGVVELIVGDLSLGTQTTSTNATWDTPGWTEGNEYVVFRNVKISGDGSFQIVSKPSADGTAVINGVQILQDASAPVITKQPTPGTAFDGDTVVLSVEATGTNLTYQWRLNDVALDGKTGATLEIANFGNTNVGMYSVSVKNDTAETLSKSAGWGVATRASGQLIDINYTAHLNPTFSVKTGPAAIGVATNDFWNVYSRDVSSLTDWRSGGVVSGLKFTDGTATTASLTVTNAGGAWVTLMGDPMMQSYLYPLDRSGEIRSELTGLPAQRYDVYVYAHGRPPEENAVVDLRVGDAIVDSRSTSSQPGWDAPAWVDGNQFVVFRGIEVTDATTLQVISHGGEAGLAVINGIQLAAQPSVLTIVTQPESQAATNSQQVIFAVTADGSGTLRYQWFKNGLAIAGATNQQFTIHAAVVADAGRYAVRVQNDSATAVSRSAALTVDGVAGGSDDGGGPGPTPSITITQQPVGGTFFENDPASLSVVASSENLTYQWFKGLTALAGKTNATLEIPSFSVTDVGSYSVVISSGGSSVTSAQASLTLAQRASSHLLNVDYTAHLNPAFSVQTGPAAIGNSSNDFWNVYSRDTTNLWAWRDRGTVSDLKWADGSSSGIALSVTNAMGAWLSAPIDAMFTSYLYPLGPGSITSALQNLPDGKYDFYVYAHGQPDGENTAITLNVDGVEAATLSTSSLHGWNTPDWVEGNQYVVFRGIEVASGTVVQIISSGGRSGLAVINGLQISVANSDLHMTTQPVSQNVTAGDPVTFSASAEGSGTLSYQWFKDGAPISGATSNEFTIAHATGGDRGTYYLRIQNGSGTLLSHGASLTIDTLGATTPVINAQPVGGTFFAGDHVVLSVSAAGTNLTYQWKKDDITLDGKTGATLDIGSFTNSDVGLYAVTVSNIAGSTNSSRVAVALATRANGPVLSVNYTAHLNPAFRTKTGPAAIGVASGDFWNVYSRDVGDLWDWQEGGSVSNLKWTDGSDSGVTLSVSNAQGAWFTFSDDAMMQSYLYPLSRSGDLVSTLTNLPPQKYDIYVYAHGQPDTENAEIVLKVGGSPVATNSTSSLPGWVGPAWVNGNQYVLFSGVDVAAGQTVEIISRGGVSGLPVINGLQLAGPAPMFTSALRGRKAKTVEFSSVGTPKLRLQGRADAQYTVYVSADGVNWTPLGTFQAVNGLIDIVDSSAEGQGARFYKAVLAE